MISSLRVPVPNSFLQMFARHNARLVAIILNPTPEPLIIGYSALGAAEVPEARSFGLERKGPSCRGLFAKHRKRAIWSAAEVVFVFGFWACGLGILGLQGWQWD